MKSLMYLTLAVVLLSPGMLQAQNRDKKGWQSLFDGKTLKGWRAARKDTLPDMAWSAKHGELVFDPSKGHGGDIITQQTFKDFELSVDFKVSEGGNSGIKYFLIPNTSLGCEYQIIDDAKHPDAQLGRDGNRRTASLYDIMPARVDKPYKGAGVWNTAVIKVKGNHVEHWLNGSKVLEYNRDNDQFRQAIAQSKFKTTSGFATAATSSILLQAHGDLIQYKNIKIKEL